jgi:hypothetical protein
MDPVDPEEERPEIVPGSGVAVEPARLGTIVSLRLPSDFAAALRDVANRRSLSMSDLLRLAAGAVLCEEGMCTCPSCPSRQKGAAR